MLPSFETVSVVPDHSLHSCSLSGSLLLALNAHASLHWYLTLSCVSVSGKRIISFQSVACLL